MILPCVIVGWITEGNGGWWVTVNPSVLNGQTFAGQRYFTKQSDAKQVVQSASGHRLTWTQDNAAHEPNRYIATYALQLD